jgi:hypothetical protein
MIINWNYFVDRLIYLNVCIIHVFGTPVHENFILGNIHRNLNIGRIKLLLIVFDKNNMYVIM